MFFFAFLLFSICRLCSDWCAVAGSDLKCVVFLNEFSESQVSFENNQQFNSAIMMEALQALPSKGIDERFQAAVNVIRGLPKNGN